jgi:hypothetical protein
MLACNYMHMEEMGLLVGEWGVNEFKRGTLK